MLLKGKTCHSEGDPPAAKQDDAGSRKKTTDIDECDKTFVQVDLWNTLQRWQFKNCVQVEAM